LHRLRDVARDWLKVCGDLIAISLRSLLHSVRYVSVNCLPFRNTWGVWQTDRQTDGARTNTSRHHIPRFRTVSRSQTLCWIVILRSSNN